MPAKNRIKIYVPEAFYHVYNRGLDKQLIFIDNTDYSVFLSLFKRYLANETVKDPSRRTYEKLANEVELLAYCLIPNHFHLLIYQIDSMGMPKLVQRVLTSYSMYFNKKYKRTGPLFQDTYRASQISSDEYLQHVSRYIHLNPKNWRHWDFSSLRYYQGSQKADWINVSRVLRIFRNNKEYLEFVADYEDYKRSIDEIKYELADH
ncbi:transposase [Candidatus Saccharibacteria bacterium]|nr:transposase [Candidatus Saccharibacteria bacterium]